MLKSGGILFLSFIVLAGLEFGGSFRDIDPAVTQILQSIIPRIFDVPLSFFSILGSAEITSLAVLGIFIFIFIKKRKVFLSLGLFAVLVVFELIGKFILYHPGPPKNFFRYDLPFSTPAYVNTPYSFPSGHVSRTVFIAVILIFLVNRFVANPKRRKLLGFGLAVFSLVMMMSRVYLGEHWTSDVIGGALLGSAIGILAMVYY